MPKKLNFLGGQQNYDPNNGQYEPDLTNKQGEPVKGFSSFKKSDDEKQKSSFDTYNDKRTGKESTALREQIEKNTDYKEIREKWKSGDTSEETDAAYQKYTVQNDALIEISNAENELEKAKEIVERSKATMNTPEYKELKQKVDNGDANDQDLNNYWKPIYEKQIAETVIENLNENKQAGEEIVNSAKDTEVGKVTKYSPFLRQSDGSWKKDDTQQKRVKTLNNGLAMETKAQPREMIYHEQVGKYRLVDVETGTTVGWAKDFDDALKKSNDADFIGAINRAKVKFFEKHPEIKEQSGKPVDYNAKRLGKTEGEMAKKEMEKARKTMDKFWASTHRNESMKKEMDALLSNFEHDNDKKGALETAKKNIAQWQRFNYLDTNELRDPKLVYFKRMVDYMEKNL